jgi:hypothetical protein
MKIVTILAGLVLCVGLSGAANATINCNKVWSGAKNKTCTNSDTGVKITVDADLTVTQIQQQFQQQQQSQESTNVNTNVNSNTANGGAGGSATIKMGDVYMAPAINGGEAHWCFSTLTGAICAPLKVTLLTARQALIDHCLNKRGDDMAYTICIANIDDSFQIKRSLKQGGVYGN